METLKSHPGSCQSPHSRPACPAAEWTPLSTHVPEAPWGSSGC